MILPFLREIGRQSAAREIQLWDNRADTPDTGGGCRRMPDSGEGIAVPKEGLAQRACAATSPKDRFWMRSGAVVLLAGRKRHIGICANHV